ncbi:MAG: glycosyl transferase [Candidatus Ozemobacteraceae bacterium]
MREIETPEILAIKSGRSRAEYCWTLTPFLPKKVMEMAPSAQRVTYVDADCWFINDPRRIFQEMDDAGKDVLITPHHYLPQHDLSATSGIYCVQFMPFRRTPAGIHVLLWWQERCLEWCFARLENNRFGDQKYLDHWPEKFKNAVHVLGNPLYTLAPWNASRYGDCLNIAEQGCLYHFQGLRIYKKWRICLCISGAYLLPGNILEQIYSPYLENIASIKKDLWKRGIQIDFAAQTMFDRLIGLAGWIRNRKKRTWHKI